MPGHLSAVAGFPISRGALACGIVPRRDEDWLRSYLSSIYASATAATAATATATATVDPPPSSSPSSISEGIKSESGLPDPPTLAATAATAHPIRILAMDRICDESNLGSAIRCAAAFGISAVVLSHDSCDAWYR